MGNPVGAPATPPPPAMPTTNPTPAPPPVPGGDDDCVSDAEELDMPALLLPSPVAPDLEVNDVMALCGAFPRPFRVVCGRSPLFLCRLCRVQAAVG